MVLPGKSVRAYLSEVVIQCKFVISAANNVTFALGQSLSTDPEVNRWLMQHEVFRALHSLLTHASNVSKLLWPPKLIKSKTESVEHFKQRATYTEERGKELRRLLSVSDDSILKSRALRDHLDHFDERLDDWATTTVKRMYLQDYIGPAHQVAGVDARDRMRSYDPETKEFLFRGETYDLQALVSALNSLHLVAKRAFEESWPQVLRPT